MFDLTAIEPFVIGFLVLGVVAGAVAVAILVRIAADLRQERIASSVVSIGDRSAGALVTGRAA